MTKLAERWKRARTALREGGYDGIILTSEPSVYYLSATVASRPPGLILATEGESEPVLVCRGGESDSVAKVASIEVVAAGSDAAATLEDVLRGMGVTEGVIGFEDAVMTYAQATALQASLGRYELRPASQLVDRLRLVKDDSEIDLMRRAGAVSDEAMTAAIDALRSGKSETLAAAAAESTMRRHGMFIAYETLIGSGFRSGLLRRYPNFTVPEPDDVIKIDLAAKISFASGYGYHTDQTRSITVGAPSAEKRDAFRALQDVQEATLSALRPGRTVAEVSREGLAAVKGTRYESLISMSGHGIGLDIHEWPSFGPATEVVLEPGQCYAVEPHLVVPQQYTMCFEDTLVITESGHERITNLPYELWG